MSPAAFLLDLDGTLYTAAGPIPGAVDALTRLQRRGIPFRLITNTTSRPRRAIIARLREYGFAVEDRHLLTPSRVAGRVLDRARASVVAPFVPADTLGDLTGSFSLQGGVARGASVTPDAVLVGDLGAGWTPALVNEAFRYLMDGAALVALQKGRYWLAADGLRVDAGAWVAALEYASGCSARVCGKPEPAFFEAALASLEPELGTVDRSRIVMVGDDCWNDVAGGQRAGLQGWLVRTGKFREKARARADVTPERIVTSVVEALDG